MNVISAEPVATGLEGLKVETDRGLAELAEGWVQEFVTAHIIECGRTLLASRSRPA